MKIPLDTKITELADLPYTLSYVVRKRMQIDNLSELPKEKRPPEDIIWDGTSEDMDNWLDKVYDKDKKEDGLVISVSDIEG